MRFYSVMLAVVATAFTFVSCSKEENEPPAKIHDYSKEWDIETVTGPLYYYYIALFMDDNQGGSAWAQSKDNNFTFPNGSLTWTRFEKDSVKIEFEFGAYPDDKFELRGLADDASAHIHGQYFQVNKNNPADRVNKGTFTMKED